MLSQSIPRNGLRPYNGRVKVRAATLSQVGSPFVIKSIDLDPPQAGEVLVRIVAAGVCHSDWHLVTGATSHPLPVIAGHEGAGVVTAVGTGVDSVQVGDHVALNWAPRCGRCFYCIKGQPSLCGTYVKPIWAGTMLDGTTRFHDNGQSIYHFSGIACFADHTVVPEQCCVPLPKNVPLPIAALIGCAVTTGVGAALNTAKVEPGSSVVVFGVGGVGLSIVMGAQLAGAGQILVLDRSPEKIQLAQSFGATLGKVSSNSDIEWIRSHTDGRGADTVFEAIGVPELQERCLEAVRPGGTVVLAGISPMGSGTNLPGAVLVRQEKTVKGSYYGSSHPARDFPLFADLYLKGKLDLDRLVTKTFDLDQINEAYAEMLSGKTARGMITF